MKLEDFRQKYLLLQKKYDLPAFDEMNSAFDIGRIRRDSGNLLRDIRRTMVEKFVYYLKLVEVMINPSQASPILLMLLKEISSDDRKIIDSVLNSFVEIEIASHVLDVHSTENDESKLITKIFDVWNKKKDEVLSIIKILEKNLKRKTPSPNKISRDYFN
ncbi:MAG: hypothetical protein AABX23_02180 [Nanoarchaeota archaeon]